jgi:hypothetical protein
MDSAKLDAALHKFADLRGRMDAVMERVDARGNLQAANLAYSAYYPEYERIRLLYSQGKATDKEYLEARKKFDQLLKDIDNADGTTARAERRMKEWNK